ncbi:phytoene/squalene synthase family protein [Halorussus sp. MSC15.2]|uniref:phytoene/squalene synthase family protein n=1 Tax=Halorussus sp. MSC15.2 TaxID=2283638 RepID=UPI0013D1BFF4|nr:phytoene/squalene synthase family protein [Halorussus sp. MSC15.2]NEU59252.1 phytoene/squalene synthase family protein [Halorussus sp. MSC15.2]
MVTDRQLRRSKAIQQRTGRTFHFATRLLPERVRHPTYVLYAFFRVADEVVDGATDRPPEEQRDRLERLRAQALGREETDDDVLAAFQEVRERRGIPDEEVERFIDAMLSDIEKCRWESYDELETYMRGSAAAVGVMMLSVMGVEDPERAKPHAVALGEAFQLTNFLRDVREDIEDHDRIYLPGDTRERHDVTESDVRRCDPTDGFRTAMAHELRRTERKYREGVVGIEYLPQDCQFAVLYAAVLYAEHHRLIRALDYDVFSSPPEVGAVRAAWLWVKTRWHWQRSRDPVTVFRAVSAIPEDEGVRAGPEHQDGTPQAD